jgi:hypothetical protein
MKEQNGRQKLLCQIRPIVPASQMSQFVQTDLSEPDMLSLSTND